MAGPAARPGPAKGAAVSETAAGAGRVVIGMPVLNLGGTEIQVLSLVQALRGAGRDVLVCCYYEFDRPVVEQFERAGARVVPLGLDRSGVFRLGGAVRPIRWLRDLLGAERPGTVHVHCLAPGLLPIVAARLAAVLRNFATVHIAGAVAYCRKARRLLRLASLSCKIFSACRWGVERLWFGEGQDYEQARCYLTFGVTSGHPPSCAALEEAT